MLRGYTRKFKPLEILTEEQVESIHSGTLGVLWETGVVFHHEKALKLFKRNGCKVDCEDASVGRVHFPPGLVEECLRRAPSSFHMKARDSKNDLLIGGDTLYTGVGCGMQDVDLDTWEMQVPTRKKNYDSVTVLDALDNVHKLGCYTPYFGFEGIPPSMAMLESDASRIRNSAKVLGFAYANDSEVFSIQMAQAVGIEAVCNFNASPPLTFYADAIEACFRFIEAELPVQLPSGTVMGGSAPATYAAAMITNNAEIIAALVLTQLIKPGTRIIACDFTFPQDMRTGNPGFGQIGCSIHQVMFNQIWRRYEIPKFNGGSGTGYSNSKSIDFQNAYERSMGVLLNALSGTNYIFFVGAVHGELSFSPVLAVLDDDIAGMVGRFIEGVQVSDETMALDLINEVGPIPGFYLNKPHTRNWWQKEQFVPKSADRLTYPEWLKTGKKNCLDYAKERMEAILATHKVSPPLTPSQEEDIERILNEARNYYRKKGQISDAEWEIYMKDFKSPNYPYG